MKHTECQKTDITNIARCTGFKVDILCAVAPLLKLSEGLDHFLVFVNSSFDINLILDHSLSLVVADEVGISDNDPLVDPKAQNR